MSRRWAQRRMNRRASRPESRACLRSDYTNPTRDPPSAAVGPAVARWMLLPTFVSPFGTPRMHREPRKPSSRPG